MSAPDGRHPPIDGLRALAAIAVLLTHAAIFSGLVAAGGDAARYAQRLEVGVAVFFVISGFVLYRPFLLARLDGRELPRVGRYAGRRALRIVPAYWLALTVAAIALSLPGVLSLSGVVTYYGFGQIYSTDTFPGGLVQAWTLCVEVTFYAFLPLFAWAMRRGGAADRDAILRREAYALLGLAAFSLAWKAAFVYRGSPDQVVLSPWLHSLPAYLDHFALGMGLALAVSWRTTLPRAVAAARRRRRGAGVLGREPADRDRLPAVRALHALAVARPARAVRGGRDRARRRRRGRRSRPRGGRARARPAAPRCFSGRSPTGSTSGT